MNESDTLRSKATRPHWGHLLLHRWPTALGIVVAALTALGAQINRGFVSALASIIVFMALVYLAAAVLGRRSSAWPVFGAGFVVIAISKLLGLGNAATLGFLAAAVLFLVLGVVRGQWRGASGLPLETLGMFAFGAVGLAALSVSLTWAGYLAAAALFAHAAWDAVHLWRERVVARSYAEFCAVLDVALGAAILVMMASR